MTNIEKRIMRSRGLRGLRGDQSGAILVIGLFAALSLCGALWMIVGLGDAIITHDRGQEAADSAALSSAIVHARAMNATAGINLTMLSMVGAYLTASVVADLLLTFAAHVMFFPQYQDQAMQIGGMARQTYETLVSYEQGMGRTFQALDRAQVGLAAGAPFVAIGIADEAATHYQFSGMSMGWSNFSGEALPRKEEPPYSLDGSAVPTPPKVYPQPCKNANAVCDLANTLLPILASQPAFVLGTSNGHSLGLPVAEELTTTLCIRTGGVMFDTLGVMLRVQNIGPISGHILKAIGGAGAGLPLGVHCSDSMARNTLGPMVGMARDRDVWFVNGPKRMTVPNGQMPLRVLGWAVSKEDYTNDDALRRVKLASYNFSATQDRLSPTYHAQAEFYYDCDAGWHAGQCNDAEISRTGVGYEHALYWMRWKARLTRTRSPERVFNEALNRVITLGNAIVSSGGVPASTWSKVATNLIGTPASPAKRSLH